MSAQISSTTKTELCSLNQLGVNPFGLGTEDILFITALWDEIYETMKFRPLFFYKVSYMLIVIT